VGCVVVSKVTVMVFASADAKKNKASKNQRNICAKSEDQTPSRHLKKSIKTFRRVAITEAKTRKASKKKK
jgi:hypothetical protein